MMRIREVIIVEGRDDTAAVDRALDADTIETHGFGIAAGTWELIEKAYRERGIIVFTDPDHAGEEIRRRITEKFPEAGQAHLSRDEAAKGDDIGIENASAEAIKRALELARPRMTESSQTFTMEDMRDNGLSGTADAAEKRRAVGSVLGIGYGNSSGFLKKLNGYGITKTDLNEALFSLGDKRYK